VDEPVWIEWVEPFGPDNEPVYLRVRPQVAIAVTRKLHREKRPGEPPLTDQEALDSFIAVHWAKRIF
jgi:hypothetical protein